MSLLFLLGGGVFPVSGDSFLPVLDICGDSRGEECYILTAEPGGLYSCSSKLKLRHLGQNLSPHQPYALSFSPSGELYLGTFGEMLVSRNRGKTWTSAGGNGDILDVVKLQQGGCLARHWNKGLLYSCGEEPAFQPAEGLEGFFVTDILEDISGTLWAATLGGGIFTSSDGGKQWAACKEGPANPFVLCLAESPEKKILFAGTLKGGVYRRDSSGSWEPCSSGLPSHVSVQALAVDDSGNIWAGTHEKGLFRSFSSGKSWSPFDPETLGSFSVTALAPFQKEVLMGTEERGLFFLDPKGAKARFLPFSDAVVGVGSVSPGTLYGLTSSGRLFFSGNAGKSWTLRGEVGASNSCRVLLPLSSREIVAGTSKGSYFSRDSGKTWSFRGFPRVDREIPKHNADLFPQGPGVLLGMVRAGNQVFAATSHKELFRMDFPGGSWKVVEAMENMYGTYAYCLVSDGKDQVALGTEKGVLYSPDRGKTWKNIYIIYGITSAFFDSQGILWGRSQNGVWRFPPGDMENPQVVDIQGLSRPYMSVLGEIFSGNEEDFFALVREKLVRLVPQGELFVPQPSNLGNLEIHSFLGFSPKEFFAGTPEGLYVSWDGGKTWDQVELP